MSLFGSLRKPTKQERPEPQRRKSRSRREDMTETEKEDKRVKRERRRSLKPETDVEGFTTDAGPVTVDGEATDAEVSTISTLINSGIIYYMYLLADEDNKIDVKDLKYVTDRFGLSVTYF